MKILKALKWLYPGMGVKRWVLLTVFGVIMISMGFVMVISEQNPKNKTSAGIVIILGVLGVVTRIKPIIKSLPDGECFKTFTSPLYIM